MEIQCDECGAVAESVMPESAKDGDFEHTLLPHPVKTWRPHRIS